MNGNSTVPVVVEGGGEQVVAHVGLHALGSLADRLGLGSSLSARIAQSPLRVHDRGKVLVHAMLMLAGGGEACSDIERLRAQPSLFGAVPSDSTLYRTVRSIDSATLANVWGAVAETRRQVWRRSSATTGNAPVILDLDASLIDIHSENKEGTAANYKHGFGFSPMFCFADATGEALAGLLRPGNATANSIGDQLAVLDAAVGQLPDRIAAGHHCGDDGTKVRRELQVRADSAGGSARLAGEFRARNIGFSVVARTNPQVQAAISRAAEDESRWQPALTQAGEERDGASVAELTDLIDLSGWPEGTRFIVRREPLHPGAQTSLFRRWSSGSGATTPTGPAAPWTPTCTCARTPTSKTTSVDSRPPASNGSRSPISTPTERGWRLCASPPTSSAGSSCSACAVRSPKPNPRRSAGSSGTPQHESSDTLDATSCASSTTGPTPT